MYEMIISAVSICYLLLCSIALVNDRESYTTIDAILCSYASFRINFVYIKLHIICGATEIMVRLRRMRFLVRIYIGNQDQIFVRTRL